MRPYKEAKILAAKEQPVYRLVKKVELSEE